MPRPVHAFEVCKALGSPVRLQLLSQLSQQGEVTQSVIRETAALGKSMASYHLKILLDAGLVEARKSGRSVSYVLRREALGEAQRAVQALLGAADRERRARPGTEVEPRRPRWGRTTGARSPRRSR